MYIEQVPKHVAKFFLPGLKVGDLVKTRHDDQSQGKNFETKELPAGIIGRVKKIFDFGKTQANYSRFLCTIKFEGHPLTTFYTEELLRVRI
jgi:hypothetical protein